MFSHHSGESVDTYNPSTGEKYRTYKLQTEDEAKDVIELAHLAFLTWRESSLEDRAQIWRRMAELLERDKQELAEMMTRQMGKPVQQGLQEIDLCKGICEYTAENGPGELSDEERNVDDDERAIVTYQPLGVILGMQPWNFPFYQCMRYSLAVMMAGNTTVFKHADICFETAERIEKLFIEAGLPEDVFAPIYVSDETADALIGDDFIRGVTFTGSSSGGKIVGRIAGENLKKSVLELGGSDAYVVLEDSNIDSVVETCIKGRIFNNGQTCVAAKRFIIEDGVYEEFKEKFVAGMKEIKFGNPMDDSVDMGPLSRKDLREKLHDQVTETVSKGAKLLCGGEIPDGEGYFYPSTVLEDIPEGSPAYDDELFGPVAGLFRAQDADEAMRMANEHRYGLGGGIFCNDKERAIELARTEMETGLINVNTYGAARPNLPFGGVKESGYGREHGGFGMKEFVNAKAVVVG